MDIKVREVSAEEKSTQEIEKELLEKHEQKQQEVQEPESTPVEEPVENQTVEEPVEIEGEKKEDKGNDIYLVLDGPGQKVIASAVGAQLNKKNNLYVNRS